MYGREAQIQTLLEAFDRTAEGSRELIFVAGYAGVGKSALVRERYKPVAAKTKAHLETEFPNLITIALDNLTADDVADLIAATLHSPQSLVQPLADLIYAKTRGNAFFTLDSTSSKPELVLDLVSVLKSSAALTREIEIDKLLGALMKILIENAGAQKGYLIGEENGEWIVQTAIDENLVTTQPGIPLNAVEEETGDRRLLSAAIVRYVIRTRETVTLNDATSKGSFRGDRYIQTHQPKSILCMPILDRTKLSGIIYLENNLISGAFPSDRLEVLKFLSVQAAISLENAKLYTSLRQSESKFYQFLEALPIGISALDSTVQFH